ncbi:MAG: hypothetical protein KTR32_30960 [Granulosicoccus sp.]|nr:hypothetical protein [Granulosicoccus sp.]
MAHAQYDGPDFESPIIEHEESTGGPIGGIELFSATVVDNDVLASVRLFYRFSGESEYTRVNMRQIASSSIYTARVFTSSAEQSASGIDYYIRAEDVAGNIVLKGFAFQPLLREFAVPPKSEPTAQNVDPDDSSSNIKWWHIALGALIVGGIAASAGGGGGGTQSSECLDTCSVTLVLDLPTPAGE